MGYQKGSVFPLVLSCSLSFTSVCKDIEAAKRDIRVAQNQVNLLNPQIKNMRSTVKRER